MTTPDEIQAVLDRARAIEIAAYIERRNKHRPDAQATLKVVCTRFRLNQAEVKRIINSVDYLDLSGFAYKPPADDSWGAQMLAAWHPQWWEDAPDGKRLVVVIEQDPGPPFDPSINPSINSARPEFNRRGCTQDETRLRMYARRR